MNRYAKIELYVLRWTQRTVGRSVDTGAALTTLTRNGSLHNRTTTRISAESISWRVSMHWSMPNAYLYQILAFRSFQSYDAVCRPILEQSCNVILIFISPADLCDVLVFRFLFPFYHHRPQTKIVRDYLPLSKWQSSVVCWFNLYLVLWSTVDVIVCGTLYSLQSISVQKFAFSWCDFPLFYVHSIPEMGFLCNQD